MGNPRPPEGTIDLAPAGRYLNLWQSGKAPNLDGFLQNVGSISADQLVAVIRVDQRERWQLGQRQPIESYLQLDSVRSASPEVPLDLILSEVLLREDLREKPSLQEYVTRFPQYENSLGKLFDLRGALRSETTGERSTRNQADPAPASAPHTQIGKYRIIETLGQGGQGVVYRAVHPTLGKDVIVKWSRRPVSFSNETRNRLQEEGRILAALDHPNLARVHDLDVEGDHMYLVMEYVRGKTLDQWAEETSPTPRQSAAMVAQVARALAIAHKRGIAHLDLKPGNIIIDEQGQPRIIDFGLAQMRDAFSEGAQPVGGTIAYMAPEQAAEDPTKLGARTDVFNLGGVLFYLLTGKPPYSGTGSMDALVRAQQGLWDRTTLRGPNGLTRICRQAMEPDPSNRYASAEALAVDLDRFLRKPKIRALAGVVTFAALCVSVLVWAVITGRIGSKSDKDKRKDLVTLSAKIPMEVRIWRKKLFVDLADAAPLVTGDELQLHTFVPSDLHASLFLWNSEGKLQHLCSREPGRESRFSFPSGEKTAPLTGSPGTEFIFLLARRSQPISLADIQSLWGNQEAWPSLPAQAVLRINGETVTREGKNRGFGTPKTRTDPEAIVRQKLATHAQRFLGHFEVFAGLAFAHKDELP